MGALADSVVAMIPVFAVGAVSWMKGNWKLLAILAALVFLVIAAWAVLGWYRAAQKLKEVQETAEQVEKARQASEADMKAQLAAEADKRIEAEGRELAAQQQAWQMAELARQFGAQAAALAGRQAEIRREIAALQTPQELEVRIKRDLGLRHPDDLNRPGFLKDELAAMAQAVSEYPVAMQRLDELEKKVGALDRQLAAQGEELQAVRDQLASERRSRAALEQGYTELKGHYVTLYNSIGVRKRSPRCLWLWKCADNKLPTPKPEDLAIEVRP